MKDITTRCHSCARPFEIVHDEPEETFEQYDRPYFTMETTATCPHCGRFHGVGFSMEIVEVQA